MYPSKFICEWYTSYMAKQHSKFTCQQCGYVSPQYLGKCPECGAWNSLVETVNAPVSKGLKVRAGVVTAQPVKLSEIKPEPKERISTGITELDYVLGGGLV